MAKPKFFYDGEFIQNSDVVLSEFESRHAAGARRLRVGDDVVLLNGQGSKAKASLIDTSNRKALIAKINLIENMPEVNYRLEIAVAIPKGDRQKVMLDMLTQIGVTHITPLDCQHSVTPFKDNLRQRWQRSLIESSKQCERVWLPLINEPRTVAQLVEKKKNGLLLYCDAAGKTINNLIEADDFNVQVLIGPEGGFSEDELDIFKNKQIVSTCLAPNILRTEAAAIVVASQLINLL